MSITDQIEQLRDECDMHHKTIGRALSRRDWKEVSAEAGYLRGACRELEILDRKPILLPMPGFIGEHLGATAEIMPMGEDREIETA